MIILDTNVLSELMRVDPATSVVDWVALAFNSDAAASYADIAVARRRKDRPISQFDAQIAAIARSSGALVATRNVVDFEGCGIELINPL